MGVVGDNLKKYRSQKKMQQKGLAKMLNVSAKAVSSWETGRTEPDERMIIKICEVIGCTPNELFGWHDDMQLIDKDKISAAVKEIAVARKQLGKILSSLEKLSTKTGGQHVNIEPKSQTEQKAKPLERGNIMKCRKCGDNIINNKNYAKGCLEEYKEMASSELCPNCNAVDSVVNRLSAGKSLCMADLKMLPKYLVFDPKNNNPVEYSYGLQFARIVEGFENAMV